eukprot:765516-Hanusia_phi.AAC.1
MEKPIIAYGNASFALTGRGEKTVPVQRIKRECQKRYQTFHVDEFRTSKCCRRCGGVLSHVQRRQVCQGAERTVCVRIQPRLLQQISIGLS